MGRPSKRRFGKERSRRLPKPPQSTISTSIMDGQSTGEQSRGSFPTMTSTRTSGTYGFSVGIFHSIEGDGPTWQRTGMYDVERPAHRGTDPQTQREKSLTAAPSSASDRSTTGSPPPKRARVELEALNEDEEMADPYPAAPLLGNDGSGDEPWTNPSTFEESRLVPIEDMTQYPAANTPARAPPARMLSPLDPTPPGSSYALSVDVSSIGHIRPGHASVNDTPVGTPMGPPSTVSSDSGTCHPGLSPTSMEPHPAFAQDFILPSIEDHDSHYSPTDNVAVDPSLDPGAIESSPGPEGSHPGPSPVPAQPQPAAVHDPAVVRNSAAVHDPAPDHDPVVQDIVARDTVLPDSVVQNNVVQDSVVQDSDVQNSVVQDPVVQGSVVPDSAVPLVEVRPSRNRRPRAVAGASSRTLSSRSGAGASSARSTRARSRADASSPPTTSTQPTLTTADNNSNTQVGVRRSSRERTQRVPGLPVAAPAHVSRIQIGADDLRDGDGIEFNAFKLRYREILGDNVYGPWKWESEDELWKTYEEEILQYWGHGANKRKRRLEALIQPEDRTENYLCRIYTHKKIEDRGLDQVPDNDVRKQKYLWGWIGYKTKRWCTWDALDDKAEIRQNYLDKQNPGLVDNGPLPQNNTSSGNKGSTRNQTRTKNKSRTKNSTGNENNNTTENGSGTEEQSP
ncbi:hypothetical protein V8F20_003304 [Naviculisporaceae sp. PSN 640]